MYCFALPPAEDENTGCFYPHLYLALLGLDFWILDILWYEMVKHCGLNLCFLLLSTFAGVYWPFVYSSLWSGLQLFCPFFNRIFKLFIWQNSWYILNMSPLPDTRISGTASPVCGLPIHWKANIYKYVWIVSLSSKSWSEIMYSYLLLRHSVSIFVCFIIKILMCLMTSYMLYQDHWSLYVRWYRCCFTFYNQEYFKFQNHLVLRVRDWGHAGLSLS